MEKQVIKTPYLKKLLFVGESGVGKSNLILKLADDTFTSEFISTVGVDYKITYTADSMFKLQVWDTSGQERFRSIANAYYRGAQIMVFVFSVDDRKSLDVLQGLSDFADQNCGTKIEKLLIGNKNDCVDRKVSIDEAEKWAIDHDMTYLDFSAKNDLRATLLSKITEIVEKHHSITN